MEDVAELVERGTSTAKPASSASRTAAGDARRASVVGVAVVGQQIEVHARLAVHRPLHAARARATHEDGQHAAVLDGARVVHRQELGGPCAHRHAERQPPAVGHPLDGSSGTTTRTPGWSCRFSPRPGRSTPERSSSTGEWMAPAHTTTSAASSSSPPTSRTPPPARPARSNGVDGGVGAHLEVGPVPGATPR